MVREPYSIVKVNSAWEVAHETMGTKEKFWLQFAPKNSYLWLFKYPTKNTGEHWAEKIAYEVSRKMRIVAPEVQLAYCDSAEEKLRGPGSITQSFSRVKAKRDEGGQLFEYQLYNGNRILAGMDSAYQDDVKYGQSMHSIQRIFTSMKKIFQNSEYVAQCHQKLAEYVVFDAVIGNVDRHHENWGVLLRKRDEKWIGRLAPTFDHASSLGRELQDRGTTKSRERYLTELGIERYAKKARGAIYTDEQARHAPSPIDLVRWCLQQEEYRKFFRSALRKLEHLDDEIIGNIVAQIPANWMSQLAREFAIKFVAHNLSVLKSL